MTSAPITSAGSQPTRPDAAGTPVAHLARTGTGGFLCVPGLRGHGATVMWWRGLRSRPLVNLLLLELTTLAVATAVLGPLLVRATQQATVADTVASAGTGTALTVYGRGEVLLNVDVHGFGVSVERVSDHFSRRRKCHQTLMPDELVGSRAISRHRCGRD